MKPIAMLCVALVGCAAPTPQESVVSVEKEVAPLSRTEVIAGINECESAGMRPVVVSTKRKVNGQPVPTIIEITCLPKLK